MKLIQTPSLITGAILGASLITLSAASNDSALGGLHVFVPGTTVSSTDVNDNFTMVVDEVTTLEGRVDNLEGTSSQTELLDFFNPVVLLRDNPSNLSITVPQGFTYKILGGSTVGIFTAWGSGTHDLFGLGEVSQGNLSVLIDGMHEVEISKGIQQAMSLTLLPGTTITFIAPPNSDYIYSNLHVNVEKSSYNLQM